MFISFLLIALLGAITRSVAYPTGAPLSTCSTLLPGHKGSEPQNGKSPYTVTAVKIGDNKFNVTISAPPGEDFKGFLLQARSADDRNKFVVGEFETHGFKGLSCDGHENSALTHVNADPKQQVTTEWTGPADVIFRATVVKSYTEYWTNIDSEAIKANPWVPFQYKSCFESKGCVGLPALCVNYTNCEILLTYQSQEDGIRFALHGSLNINEYMSMNLSTDNLMGEDLVHACIKLGSGIKDIRQRTSWNRGKSNSRTEDFPGSKINTIVNNWTTCEWTYAENIDFPGKADKTAYIRLALGKVDRNGELLHPTAESSTAEPVDFYAYGLSDRRPADRVHVSDNKGSPEKQLPATATTDQPDCSSQLSFGLIWLAFFGVFYAGGRNALGLV